MELDLPDDWLAAADTLRERRRIAVLGPNGAGKSTFCHWLAERLGAQLLDADVGQQSLGPPATAALRSGTRTLTYFVGSTTPLGSALPLLAGIAALAAAAGPEPLVVNTSGLIAGPGIDLKHFKMDALGPDAVVAIQRGQELDPLLTGLRHLPILRLTPSQRARRRSTSQRRSTRRAAFAQHLEGAVAMGWDEGEIVLRHGPGQPGLLCGLGGADGWCLGLGVLVERADGRLTVATAVPRESVRLLRFGRMLVGIDGTELGLLNMRQAPRR